MRRECSIRESVRESYPGDQWASCRLIFVVPTFQQDEPEPEFLKVGLKKREGGVKMPEKNESVCVEA